jgi:signal transduction histidine kinase
LGNAKYLDYAKDINDSGVHLLGIISDILDLSKIESGKTELREENVDVMQALGSCVTLVRERAEEAGVSVKYDAPSGMPILYADQLKFKQILINLLSNAINFTAAGGRVTMSVRQSMNDGFVIQVADTGIGIAPEDIPKALAPFQQIDGANSRKNNGTGIGLSLTKALIELHGGSLDIESQVGIGTTATVRFPAERSVTESAIAPMSEERAHAQQ